MGKKDFVETLLPRTKENLQMIPLCRFFAMLRKYFRNFYFHLTRCGAPVTLVPFRVLAHLAFSQNALYTNIQRSSGESTCYTGQSSVEVAYWLFSFGSGFGKLENQFYGLAHHAHTPSLWPWLLGHVQQLPKFLWFLVQTSHYFCLLLFFAINWCSLWFTSFPEMPMRLLFRSVVCSHHTYKPQTIALTHVEILLTGIAIILFQSVAVLRLSASAPSLQVWVIFFAKFRIGLDEVISSWSNLRAHFILHISHVGLSASSLTYLLLPEGFLSNLSLPLLCLWISLDIWFDTCFHFQSTGHLHPEKTGMWSTAEGSNR